MQIEVSIFIAAAGLILSLIATVAGMRRSARCDAASDATQLTTVIVKLETIGGDVSEIKSDLRTMKAEIKEYSERLIKVEQQVKVLNKTVFGGGKGDN